MRCRLLVPREWWAVEGGGHGVELVDQRVGERDAVLRAAATRRSASSSPGTRMRSVPGASADACTSSIELVDVGAEVVERAGSASTSSTTKLAPLATRSQPVSSDSLCSVAPKLLSASTPAMISTRSPMPKPLCPPNHCSCEIDAALRVGGGERRARRSPTPRGSIASPRLRARRILLPGRRGGGDVVDDVGVPAGGHRVRERVGREQARSCRRTAARSWRRSGTPSRSTRRPTPASCSSASAPRWVSSRTETVAMPCARARSIARSIAATPAICPKPEPAVEADGRAAVVERRHLGDRAGGGRCAPGRRRAPSGGSRASRRRGGRPRPGCRRRARPGRRGRRARRAVVRGGRAGPPR